MTSVFPLVTIWWRPGRAIRVAGVRGFLKAMPRTLVPLGEIPATSLTEIPFGWEVSDTGGQPVTLSMSKFDVSLQN